jgi:hypothetical protein
MSAVADTTRRRAPVKGRLEWVKNGMSSQRANVVRSSLNNCHGVATCEWPRGARSWHRVKGHDHSLTRTLDASGTPKVPDYFGNL